jgi:hypothetical protein
MIENMLVTTCFGLSSGHHQVTTLLLRGMYNMQYYVDDEISITLKTKASLASLQLV